MRPTERLVVFSGIIVAIVLALGPRDGGNRALAGQGAENYKLATVDVYWAAEKYMGTEDLKKKRDDAVAMWQSKAQSIEKDLQQLEDNFKVLPPNDPQVPELQKQAQAKQQEYQKLAQDRTQDLEKINSGQLIEAYKKIREASDAVASRQGYTHVFCQRGWDKQIETVTVVTTIQEMLARPLIKGIATDDITNAVLAELKLPQ